MSKSNDIKTKEGNTRPATPKVKAADERMVYGRQFLDCVTFLYAEALRLNLEALADNLEDAFEDCVIALQKDGVLKNQAREDLAEYDFLSSFRKLSKDQQLLLIEMLNASERGTGAKIFPET